MDCEQGGVAEEVVEEVGDLTGCSPDREGWLRPGLLKICNIPEADLVTAPCV
jgi:hypothetical protein